MKGDFSRWQFHVRDNFNGVLPQQGKLLIDADGIAQTRITNYWQQTAARDWVGPVAAVPADEPNAFAITQATVNADGTVSLTVGTGRLWADGMLAQLGDTGTVQRSATWLEPPIVPAAGSAATVAANVQDIVVLELWQEGINGYQEPRALIEPALGGPDTAERLHTGMAFRLARLAAGQTCKSITYNDSGLGKLTVTLQPVTVIAGDCPIPVGGGYSGFEHRLYRIEIADVNAGNPTVFKWSRENGGLVGRGTFDPAAVSIDITANLVAITTANQPGFYVEFEQWDQTRGNWQVVCAANATLNGQTLQFAGGAPAFGAYPAAKGDVFFRLWDGSAPISTFPVAAAPNQLENGIFLQFDADAPGLYRARDYWLFPVRAGGIANPNTPIDHKPPEGIIYHRVPLAEITWNGGGHAQHIDDCRAVINPLTSPRGCCTRQVGDGLTSFGEYTSIQEAIDSLPPEGGEVCILAGRYFESVAIVGRTNVSIHGCGHRTRIASPGLAAKPAANTGAVIAIAASQDIEVRSLVVEADDGDIGIEVGNISPRNAPMLARLAILRRGVADVRMRDLIVVASTSAGVSIEQARDIRLEKSIVAMRDVLSDYPAVFVSGSEIHILYNWVGPVPAAILPAIVLSDLGAPVKTAFASSTTFSKALCGIQIGGIASDVYVRWNEIENGCGNGITLGSLILLDGGGNTVNGPVGNNPSGGVPNPCANGNLFIVAKTRRGAVDVTVVVEGRLRNIHIENNRIRNMGLCGIGPIGFFRLVDTQEVVTVDGFWIVGNEINSCLRRTLARFAAPEAANLGYGGICLPDVSQTFIRDNLILNTGASLADAACGIFILHGAEIEISRNQILDTRTYTAADAEKASGFRAGIAIQTATPPGAAGVASFSIAEFSTNIKTAYEAGTPALCIQENVVNIPAGPALQASGVGAFSIRGNHFATGGAIGEATAAARCVAVANYGLPVDATAIGSSLFSEAVRSSSGILAPGPILFSQNRCSVNELFVSKAQIPSVLVVTFDDLGFHDNQCWLYIGAHVIQFDARLKAATMRVTGCRFQEQIKAADYSLAATGGKRIIISLNEANNAIYPAVSSGQTIVVNNVIG